MILNLLISLSKNEVYSCEKMIWSINVYDEIKFFQKEIFLQFYWLYYVTFQYKFNISN